MPRQPRIDAPGTLHHIICRGIERKLIFKDDTDRDGFVARLESILGVTETRCYAWALIPNHFHLLLQTGPTPISTVMRRLLTGYAVTFNRRHKRSGHLFQNRYKSIVCQDDLYLLELIRYIHLNPLRANIVAFLDDLASYRYAGHQQLLGKGTQGPVAVNEILGYFDKRKGVARKKYQTFVAEGANLGQRPELVGGGIIRSLIGAGQGGTVSGEIDYQLGDERILGDGDFVAEILAQADAQLATKDRYRVEKFGLEELSEVVAAVLEIDAAEVRAAGKQPHRVRARSLYCYWAVRELGFSVTFLGRQLGISQPAASMAVQRGEQMVAAQGWRLSELRSL